MANAYDAAVTAEFLLVSSGTFTREYNNLLDLNLELKQAKDLGFVVVTVSGTSTYHPLADVVSVTVEAI